MLFASTELIKKVGRHYLLDLDVDWLRYISIEDEYTEYNAWDLEIENVAIHFDEEAAHYEIAVGVNVEMTFLSDDNSMLGRAELVFHVNVEIQRDLLETDEKAISIKNATYEISDVKDAWEVFLDYEAEAEAYASDAYEEEHRH